MTALSQTSATVAAVDAAATATEIVAAVAQGRISARAVIEAALKRIAAGNLQVNAFTDVVADRALATADAVDLRRAAGVPLGPIAGVPFAVKNLFDVSGLPTRAGSRINRDRPPATADATLSARLEAAGGVLVGALNMGEYAYNLTGENEHDGPSRNPHDLDRLTGGSSGGSAAAVAAGFVPLALGSDTNGSIRVPSSLCGTFGLKPTYGRLSRAGSFPFVASLDHLGPLARSVDDLALAYDLMQGADVADPAQVRRPPEPTLPGLNRGANGLRIARAGGYFRTGGTSQALAAVDQAAAVLGATRVVEIPESAEARAAALLITAAEGAALHLGRLRVRPHGFGLTMRERTIAGACIPAVWVERARRFRRRYHARWLALFEDVDVVLAPATPYRAPRFEEAAISCAGDTVSVQGTLGLYTQPISFVGLPVVAAPVWCKAGLPLAVQVIAPPWREDLALRVAKQLQTVGIARAPVAAPWNRY